MLFTTLLGYFLLLVFLYVEGRLRRGGVAQSLEAGKIDRNTTRVLGYAFFISLVALLSAWALHALGVGTLPEWLAWVGILLAFAGLGLRTWANRTLGAYYTRTLKVADGQSIIREGPYRVIRHPGYLGTILTWTGVALATGNWIVLLIVLIVIGGAYYLRIETEEKLLLSSLPEYGEYRSHTWRLIPPIY
jgi:protein-S-isoprenylcysteine O-methyltransferase